MTVELSILLLNAVIIILAYTAVYPKIAGKDINKVAIFDCVTTSIALIIVASKYWDSGIVLSFMTFEVNWFWFTFLSYCVIEITVAIWYLKSFLSIKEEK